MFYLMYNLGNHFFGMVLWMNWDKYRAFQNNFDKIDQEKLEFAKKESTLNENFINWAIEELPGDKRAQIIQDCIDRKDPEWRIAELKESHINWDISKDHVKKQSVDLFFISASHLQGDKEPPKENALRKLIRLLKDDK